MKYAGKALLLTLFTLFSVHISMLRLSIQAGLVIILVSMI